MVVAPPFPPSGFPHRHTVPTFPSRCSVLASEAGRLTRHGSQTCFRERPPGLPILQLPVEEPDPTWQYPREVPRLSRFGQR